MRRDKSDIFADRNEGKALVMDNPFAQTNASHLLKPLMDMADKTNTQLIFLSGLEGESIYSRIQNIYILNLVAANLRNGMQYLKTEHTKGSDGETVIASQIEAVQQELTFYLDNYLNCDIISLRSSVYMLSKRCFFYALCIAFYIIKIIFRCFVLKRDNIRFI